MTTYSIDGGVRRSGTEKSTSQSSDTFTITSTYGPVHVRSMDTSAEPTMKIEMIGQSDSDAVEFDDAVWTTVITKQRDPISATITITPAASGDILWRWG